jgi:hypothetical protein
MIDSVAMPEISTSNFTTRLSGVCLGWRLGREPMLDCTAEPR